MEPLPNTPLNTSHKTDAFFPNYVIPNKAGIGYRGEHQNDFLTQKVDIPWLEIHSENYLIPRNDYGGGPRLAALEQIRMDYPISCHGVGLSLGSAEGLSPAHLQNLKELYRWLQPSLISEHVSWSVTDGTYLNDLLPLPYTEEALTAICRNIDHAQTVFGQSISVENPSSYMSFQQSTMAECDFMAEILKRTGCGLLLDVNNVYVSSLNHGFNAYDYIDRLPLDKVAEIHVAGHSEQLFTSLNATSQEEKILIDTHSRPVCPDVWKLLSYTLSKTGAKPVLMEWDLDIPELETLLAEARKAQSYLDALAPSASKEKVPYHVG